MILVSRQVEIFRKAWELKSHLKIELLRMGIVEALRWMKLPKDLVSNVSLPRMSHCKA